MIARKTLACAVLALGSLVAVPALGQYRTPSGTGGSTGQPSATAQAGKQLNQARQDQAKVEQLMAKAKARVRSQLLNRPEFASANAEYTRAKAALELARKQAINSLRNKPEFQKLQKEREEARAKMDAASNGSQQLSDSEIKDANDIVFRDGLALRKMETQALNDDAKYQDAKTKEAAAKAKIDVVDQQVDDALKADTDYQQLAQQLDQAKQQVEQARQAMQQAAQADRQAREAADKARSSSRSGSGTGR